jgi:CheY-like chemotaxis protein
MTIVVETARRRAERSMPLPRIYFEKLLENSPDIVVAVDRRGSIGFAKDLREIRKRDRLMTLGELAVSLAHEINNPLEVITNTMELLEEFVRRTASDEQMVVEGERFEAVQREVAKIHAIVGRVQELAAGDEYETRQYLPGTLMTNLRQETTAPPAKPAAAPTGNGTAPSIEGLTILVVDDDLGVCQSLAELLRHQGCTAVIATSALEALREIAKRRFDLVVSDVVMPDMDGYDLYMELKESQPTLPVILMTGYLYDRDHVIKRSKLAGLATGVLYKKPIDLERLKTIIHTHCSSMKAPAGASEKTPEGALQAPEGHDRRDPGRDPAVP